MSSRRQAAGSALRRWACAALLPCSATAAAAPITAVPANGVRDVSRLVAPGFRFPDARRASGITADQLQLLTPIGLPVPGIVRTAGPDATLVPDAPLAGCTTYTLELARRSGDAAPLRSGFATMCSHWQPAVEIDDARTARRVDRPVDGLEVAADGGAGFVAVWFQDDGGRRAILASRFNPETGFWSAPQDIDRHDADAGGSSVPAIASDARGRVTVVWFQALDGRDAILATRLRGSRWDTPQRLDDPAMPGNATNPQLAADAAGNVTVAWQQPDGRHTAIYAARWQRATRRWLPAHRLDRLDTPAYDPVVAAAPDGRALVAWEQGAPGRKAVYAAEFRPARRGWSAPVRLDHGAGPGRQPVLAASPDGDFTAAWVDGDGPARRIAVSRLAAGGWSRPGRLPAAGFVGAALAPALAADPAGNVALAWEQADRAAAAGARYAIFASRFTAAARHWSAPRRIDDPRAASAGSPVLAADAAGNVHCAWYQESPQGMQIYAARYDPADDRWAPAVRLSDPLLTVEAMLPAIAVNRAGSVVAVWQQYDGWRTIAAAGWLP